jgi:NTP pyrophosphatase (non-canonical NTP hydrolase)
MTRIYVDDETESLSNFVSWMGRKLSINKHKTGWAALSDKWLLNRLRQEVKELAKALDRQAPYAEIAEEAADVANIAMMIQDRLWKEEPP